MLAGIGRGFSIDEILNGKPRSATGEVWERIRGGTAYACFGGSDGAGEITIKVYGKWDGILAMPYPNGWEYHISFSPSLRGKVTDEYINTKGLIYKHHALPECLYENPSQPVLGLHREIQQRDVALNNLSGVEISVWLLRLATLFNDTQRIDLVPDVLRAYSQDKLVGRMGDHGEDFAAVINLICRKKSTKDAYLAWLRQLRPEQIDDVGTLSGAVGEPMFMLQENGRMFPAPVLSDGTLRFAALTAAFFQHDMPWHHDDRGDRKRHSPESYTTLVGLDARPR